MDTRTSQMYESKEAALEDGVPENRLITGTKEALEDVRERLKIAEPGKKLFRSFKNREPKR